MAKDDPWIETELRIGCVGARMGSVSMRYRASQRDDAVAELAKIYDDALATLMPIQVGERVRLRRLHEPQHDLGRRVWAMLGSRVLVDSRSDRTGPDGSAFWVERDEVERVKRGD